MAGAGKFIGLMHCINFNVTPSYCSFNHINAYSILKAKLKNSVSKEFQLRLIFFPSCK